MMEDYEDRDDYDPRESEERDNPLGREGCVFPGECCMPGPHFESECHTAEMLMQQQGMTRIYCPSCKADGWVQWPEELSKKGVFRCGPCNGEVEISV